MIQSGKQIDMAVIALLVVTAALASAKAATQDTAARSIVKAADVEYLYPEQVTLPAGQTSKVSLHFRVAQGLHINSHTPREDFLIPTTFSVPESSGVRLEHMDFPPGVDLTLPFDQSEKLSVYTGEFTIDTRIIASKGDHLVEAKLHYQACNSNTCMPPKTITVPIDVVGK
jgi:DsbC/DsbD-like thiol-disulfide interchange protein